MERFIRAIETVRHSREERRQRREKTVALINEEYQKRNASFQEKAKDYDLIQALEKLNQEKLQGKGTITPFLPYQIIGKYPRYTYQVNTARGGFERGRDILKALKIPVEKAVMGWELEWNRNHRVKVEIGGDFQAVGIFGGVFSHSQITIDNYFGGYFLTGQDYLRYLQLDDPSFRNNLVASLSEACDNSEWNYTFLENLGRTFHP